MKCFLLPVVLMYCISCFPQDEQQETRVLSFKNALGLVAFNGVSNINSECYDDTPNRISGGGVHVYGRLKTRKAVSGFLGTGCEVTNRLIAVPYFAGLRFTFLKERNFSPFVEADYGGAFYFGRYSKNQNLYGRRINSTAGVSVPRNKHGDKIDLSLGLNLYHLRYESSFYANGQIAGLPVNVCEGGSTTYYFLLLKAMFEL